MVINSAYKSIFIIAFALIVLVACVLVVVLSEGWKAKIIAGCGVVLTVIFGISAFVRFEPVHTTQMIMAEKLDLDENKAEEMLKNAEWRQVETIICTKVPKDTPVCKYIIANSTLKSEVKKTVDVYHAFGNVGMYIGTYTGSYVPANDDEYYYETVSSDYVYDSDGGGMCWIYTYKTYSQGIDLYELCYQNE